MKMLIQIKYSKAARPIDFSAVSDDRLLSVSFNSIGLIEKISGNEVSICNFADNDRQSGITLIYGFGDREPWGVWSIGYKSAFTVDSRHDPDNLLLKIEYSLLGIFRDGLDVELSVNGQEFVPIRLDGDAATIDLGARRWGDEAAPSRHDHDGPSRTAFVVLGMHRSGTSALTRLLSFAGAGLPRNLMQAMPDNPKGFWESHEVASVNDLMLRSVGRSWNDIEDVALPPDVPGIFEGGLVDLLRREYGGGHCIVLKDPRISLLIDPWDRALRSSGYRAAYVTAVRHPFEVANSLHGRNDMPRDYAVLLWTKYMLAILSTELRNHIVLFDDLIEDPVGVISRTMGEFGSDDLIMSGEVAATMREFIDTSENINKNIDKICRVRNKPAIELFEAVRAYGSDTSKYRDPLDKAKDWLEESREAIRLSAAYRANAPLGR